MSLLVSNNVTGRYHTEELVAAWVGHLLEYAHFAQKASSALGVAEDVLVALASVLSLRVHVQDLHNSTVGTLSQLLN